MKKSDFKKQKLNSKNQQKQGEQEDQSEQDQSIKEQLDDVKDQVKIENQDGPKKWYEDENAELDDDNKWDYLEHHGVTFPDPYIPKDLTVKYKGDRVKLNAFEQELAWYWTQTIGTEWEQNQIYRKNFAQQFIGSIKKQRPQYSDFSFFDFSQMKHYAEQLKEQRKNIPEQRKAETKREKQEQTKFYGYSIVDDVLQKVNGFLIQPPTLFKGRGKHPRAGFVKPRIQAEQITINVSDDAPIPRCHVPGHNWFDVVCKKDSTWLCSYKNDAVSSSSSHKYIFLAANSKFKGINDRKKYQKARRLKNSIQRIRQGYMRKIQDADIRNKQLGTTTYLIDKLALRVGNQKGQDEADTVGCCSLRVQHLSLLPNDQITLDFLGKDSMRYVNTVTVIHQVWKNIQIFLKNKKPTDDVFDKIDAQALNDYLKSLMDGLTAKVFRTYNASSTLQRQLNKIQIKGLNMDQKFDKYQQANKMVAILCNHQKTVGKKFLESLTKKQQYIDFLKDYLKELQKHKSQFSAKKDTIHKDDVQIQIQGKKIVKKYPSTKDKTVAQAKKLSERIARQQKTLQKKNQGKQIALGTSKTNYNDPRISVSWCKKNQVRVQKVFTKNLLSKFLWAMYTDADWEF